ncbi:rhomboid family intramembrane serine protease [Desulfonatronovibrio magnus]|uniref:rhomboid family intramembrane serine protease n=1 Tax=Desulfonatronovibrio magnus TaxID=698827 RepID=UPI0005EB95CB|nr:rhomboid family intramembrane serine protease [Desulfonatronovibrio magnus]RQD56945.1 MAG: rhomboid family intramembrane serine protease [Desulfonatronovibrio sp. MSAO_Bac4]
MIPLKDSIPNVFRPYTVWALISVNALVFIYTLGLDTIHLARFFHLYGVVPARLTHPELAMMAGYPDAGYYTLVTHMFIHGGFLHFLLNSWMMWIFADNIEDVMGPVRFLLFYVLCGAGALTTHILFNFDSPVPVVGASGAIAGVMGAYLLLYPHSRVITVFPIIFIPYIIEIPAVIFLGVWFMIQIVSALWSDVSGAGSGVAWWAHAGGFVVGMVLLPLFKNKKRCYHCYEMVRRKKNFILE